MSTQVLVSLAIVGLIGVIWYFAVQWEKKRTEAMTAACQAMGFAFEQLGDVQALRTFGDLPVFDRGHSRKARNVMSGRTADRQVKLFDYAYTTGSGKNSHTHNQTVALFPDGASGLPDFELAPEHIFHKLGQVFGYQDIDFETSPEFSSRYLLRGTDEAAVRAAFAADTLAFFSQEQGWHVEVRNGHAGVYRADKRCKPEEAPAFLADALRVLLAIRSRD